MLTALQVGMGWFPEQPGGLNRVFYDLLRHLPAAGVCARGVVAGSESVSTASGSHVHAFAATTATLPLRLWYARHIIAEGLRQARPDLVASHFSLYMWPALGLLGDTPLVVHFHGPWAQECRLEGVGSIRAKAQFMIERSVYRRAVRLITLSQAFSDILQRTYGVPRDRIRIVPGGVDLGRFTVQCSREDARQHLNLPTGRRILVTVRRLARRMGLSNLLRAMLKVKREVPESLLLIAGKGPLAITLQEEIASRGLQDHVRLLGFVADERLPLLYRAATLSIVPSIALEGFGLTTVESLAAGTPVLVTPVGGLPEVVSDLSPGLVCSGTESEALAEGMLAALDGGTILPSAEDCRTYVRSRFDWSVVAARTRDVYLEALE